MAKSDEWATPPDLIVALRKVFKFTGEVCAAADNRAMPDLPYIGLDKGECALAQPWYEHNYCNPPYSKLPQFVKKAYKERMENGHSSVLLIPAYTDTKYWHEFIWDEADQVRFLKGRLRFWENGKPGKDTARFSSAIVVFGESWWPTTLSGGWDWRDALKL